jgi:ribosomal protein L12E/L44/L45/RPP1/RPP2
VKKYEKEYDSKWEADVAKLPVVISFPGTELKSRDVVIGVKFEGESVAYPWDTLVKQSPVMDRMQGTPVLVAVGADGKSFRVFVARIDGKDAEFFLKGAEEAAASPASVTASAAQPSASDAGSASRTEPASTGMSAPQKPAPEWTLLDTTTGSEWNFQGCAISGAAQGKCLEQVYALKDYWFDWRNYHPDTRVYKR